jgi:hypothetical protein
MYRGCADQQVLRHLTLRTCNARCSLFGAAELRSRIVQTSDRSTLEQRSTNNGVLLQCFITGWRNASIEAPRTTTIEQRCASD